MSRLRQVPVRTLTIGVLVVAAACGHSTHPDNPQKQAFSVRTVSPPTDPRKPPMPPVLDLESTLAAVKNAVTRAEPWFPKGDAHLVGPSSVPLPNLVVPPTPQQGPTPVQPAGVSAGDYHSWSDWPLWQALGRCEEPGGGIDGILWANSGPVYVSGFGMARSTFNMDAHAVGLPDWRAGYAPADQIKVARYGHYVQHQYWGCGRLVPGW